MANEKKSHTPHPELKGLLLIALALLLFLSLCTFKSGDTEGNCLGLAGYGLAWLLTYLLGFLSYGVVVFLSFLGWKLLLQREIPQRTYKIFTFSLFTISAAFLLNLIAEHNPSLGTLLSSRCYSKIITLKLPYAYEMQRTYLGGVPFYYLYRDLPTFNLQRLLSDFGVGLTFSITALGSFLSLTEWRLLPLLQFIKNRCVRLKSLFTEWSSQFTLLPKKREASIEVKSRLESSLEIEKTLTKHYPQPIYEPEIYTHQEKEKKVKPTPKKSELPPTPKNLTGYQLPPVSLLNNPKKIDQPSLKKELRKQAEILEETLASFGIEAKVGEINCGPTITSFEVHPAVGVKVQKITALENDIALKLQAKSTRIIAPIPGKAAVGVEIPSLYPQEVSFKEMLLHYQQNGRKLHIPIILGKTVTGDNVISDLAKMPHCIIAGATGSGKSVCINTVVMSILMNARPDEIKLLLIDPKKVELTAYGNLPHMIAPVITEAHGAYAALNWLVKEMELRYEILKQLGLRNITAFNARTPNKDLESSLSIAIPDKMSGIVAIIDEFADLMMVSSSDLETPIARIAQMARAVGIHLILATQRPSREVITGLIKANFPTRIAFKVASRINSQIILDETGAETLLGNGDMLFLPPGSSHLIRAQGAYISDEEINKVISFICNQTPTHYLISSFDELKREECSEGEGGSGEKDTLYTQAYSIVVDSQNASTTYLQRKLKIGYARAASLMDLLENNGVIGPQEGSKPRRVIHSHGKKEEE